MTKGGTRRPRALARESRNRGTCGLCGTKGKLSKSHVPPRCAGNRGDVQRFTIITDKHQRAQRSPARIGGVHFFGLCAKCNSELQGRWDPAYCELAHTLRRFAVGDSLQLPMQQVQLPNVAIRPGAIARCVLASAFALTPSLRKVHPALADQLIEGQPLRLPENLSIFLALTPGPRGRVTGAIGGYYMFRPKIAGKNVGIMTLAQIYFPPLAWQVADGAESVLLGLQGWHDASNWCTHDEVDRADLSTLVDALPLVIHPWHEKDPQDWVELLSDENCFIIESENALPQSVGTGH